MTFTIKDFNSWMNKKMCNSNRVHSILCAENSVILFSPVIISGDNKIYQWLSCDYRSKTITGRSA